MKKNTILTLIMTSAVLGTNSCVVTAKSDLERKMSAEDPIHSVAEFDLKIESLIESSGELTDQQRYELSLIFSQLSRRAAFFRNQCSQLKLILLQNAISDPLNDTELNLIRNKISLIQKTNLSDLFSAIKQVNTVLIKNGAAHKALMNEMLNHQRFNF